MQELLAVVKAVVKAVVEAVVETDCRILTLHGKFCLMAPWQAAELPSKPPVPLICKHALLFSSCYLQSDTSNKTVCMPQ